MITTDGIKTKFEFYRKWLNTFLNKEFLNLPYKEQDKLLTLIKTFLTNCERIHKEAKVIKEKQISVKVIRIEPGQGFYTILGTAPDFDEIRIKQTASMPQPLVGDSFGCIIFSEDEKIWYSSKEELITGR
jgi:hypothetical protein